MEAGCWMEQALQTFPEPLVRPRHRPFPGDSAKAKEGPLGLSPQPRRGRWELVWRQAPLLGAGRLQARALPLWAECPLVARPGSSLCPSGAWHLGGLGV